MWRRQSIQSVRARAPRKYTRRRSEYDIDINRGIDPPVDSVQEFKVQANGCDAAADTSVGVVNVITETQPRHSTAFG